MAIDFAKKITAATVLLSAIATPAAAGQWTTGGLFDVERGVGVSFLRFLAEPGEGQMTIRCDELAGLWIDVGVAGNGELPQVLETGDDIEIELDFVRPGGVHTVFTIGPLLVRGDGAVLVELIGVAAAQIAPSLLIPADRIDVTIAGVTRSIPVEGLSDRAISLADGCRGWPVPGAELTAPQPEEAPRLIPLEAQIAAFVDQAAAGLPNFIIVTVEQCFTASTHLLEAADLGIMRQSPDFIAGINSVVQANPAMAEPLFDELDGCGGTLVVGEIMWIWVQAEFEDATEADRVALGLCLIGAVDHLALDAKKGIMRFRYGDFAAAIETMLDERVDLVGTIVEDLAECGVEL